MRFTHLAEFSKYAKYQPFKFYLLISVIACFPVTYALRQTLVCNLGLPGQRRQSGECGQDAGALQHQNDAALCPGSRQLHPPGHEPRAGRSVKQHVNIKAAA